MVVVFGMRMGHHERLFARETLAPPCARRISDIASCHPVPFNQMKHDHSLVLRSKKQHDDKKQKTVKTGGEEELTERKINGLTTG